MDWEYFQNDSPLAKSKTVFLTLSRSLRNLIPRNIHYVSKMILWDISRYFGKLWVLFYFKKPTAFFQYSILLEFNWCCILLLNSLLNWLIHVERTMYQLKVDVDMLNAIKSVLADSLALCQSKGLLWRRANAQNISQHTVTAFCISTSTLRWYILHFTTTPTQTKTSSLRD